MLAFPKNTSYLRPNAGLAQLVERFVYTEDVGSSSLSSRTIMHPNPKTQSR